MNRRKEFTRSTGEVARSTIAAMLEKSVQNLRGEYPDSIKYLVNNFSFDQTQLAGVHMDKKIFLERETNNFLDLMYLDHAILYRDIFTLQDELQEIRRLFEATIMSSLGQIDEIHSRMSDFETLGDRHYTHTDVVHETFNTGDNYALTERQLTTNPAAGVLRLPGVEEEYCTANRVNVAIELISEKVEIVDQSDENGVYNNDPTEPYYIVAATNHVPHNIDFGFINFNGYSGLIADIKITMAGVYPVTRLSLAPFTTAPLNILGIYYSNVPGLEWSSHNMTEIEELDQVVQDNREIEVNFDRIYAREIHIVIHQPSYTSVAQDTIINAIPENKAYIDYCSDVFNHILPEGFTEEYEYSNQLTEVQQAVRNHVTRPSVVLKGGTKLYTVGLYRLSIINAAYLSDGYYETEPRQMDGNLHEVAVLANGNNLGKPDEMDTATLFSIETGDKEIFITPESNFGRIMDVGVVKENLTYVSGTFSRNTEYPYKLSTHFILDEDDEYSMFLDGSEIVPGSGEVSIHEYDYHSDILLSDTIVQNKHMFDGTVVTLSYIPPSIDRYGKVYDAASVNIMDRFGPPNIRDHGSCGITDRYLYVPRYLSGSTTIDTYVGFREAEYIEATMSGDTYYHLDDTKGLTTANSNVVHISGEEQQFHLIADSYAIGPYDDLFYGIIGETVQSGTLVPMTEMYQFTTEVPYIKGTLKAHYANAFVRTLSEYTDDTMSYVLTNEEKRIFTIPADDYSGGDVTISYIPIDITQTGSQGRAGSNIAQYTEQELFDRTVDSAIMLSRYPYVDASIVNTDTFDYQNNGIFSLKANYSVVYEPITIYVNGVKAVNITQYRDGNIPVFSILQSPTVYQYYMDPENGKKLVFDRDVTGSISVHYYTMTDVITSKVSMYRSNYMRDYLTPELDSYTLLANVRR